MTLPARLVLARMRAASSRHAAWQIASRGVAVRAAGRRRRLASWLLLVTRVYAPGERAFYGLTMRHWRAVLREVAAFVSETRSADLVARMSVDDLDAFLARKRAQWHAQLQDLARPAYARTANSALSALEAQIPGGFEVMTTKDPELLRFLAEKTVRLRQVDDTLIERVRDTMLEGLGENETVSQLRRRLELEEGFSVARARNTARTETASAANGARWIGMQQEEVDGREWATAGDDAVRPSHEAMDGVVIPVGGQYTLPGGVTLLFPGDPLGPAAEICQCRCAEGPVYD